MSVNITFDGQPYIVPETAEVGWGGNTTSYLVAIAAGCLQKTGGSFTLSAETDFGASFGLQSLYYKSRTAIPATSGIIRLANNSDAISWRDTADSADLPLAVNASDQLTFDGVPLAVSGGGTVSVGTQFQLGYYAAGGTVISGLALIAASRALESDTNGLPVASAVTTAELAFVSGVTSSIQTQLGTKSDDSLVVHLAGIEVITGAKTFSSSSTIIARDYTGQTDLTIQNISNTNGATATLNLRSRSTTINGSIFLQKLPPATTTTIVSGLSLSNTFLISVAGDTVSRMIIDLAGSVNGIYFSGTNSNEYVQIDNTGHVIITPTTNQLILGLTDTVTISAPTPSASRILTIPDPGTNASFVMTQGTQTIAGVKTLSDILVMSTNKITGLGDGTAIQDAAAYGQVKILQTQYGTSTTFTTTTSTTFVNTNLSVTITPSSTSSTILIFAFGSIGHSVSGFSGLATIANGTTSLQGVSGQGDVNISGATGQIPVSLFVQDSPASTSAQTYRVRIRTASGAGTTNWGGGNAVFTSILVVEVNGL